MLETSKAKVAASAAIFALSACAQSDSEQLPGDSEDTQPYTGISPDEVLRFTGTEPFWGGTIEGGTLTFSTPEDIGGTTIVVERFAGRGGLSFSGELEGAQFDLAITPGDCSDGMSDRTYPFAATLQLGAEQRNGCAWREGDDLGPPP